MPKSDLHVFITDMRGNALRDKVELEFQPITGPNGVGGDSMEARLQAGTATEFQISGITCRGGPGTLYRVFASVPHYRSYSYFQSIQEEILNPASDDIEFWVKPGDVKDIRAPRFEALPVQTQRMLTNAKMRQEEKADEDLLGLSGPALYDALGPLRKASLLNITRKSADTTAASCLSFITSLLICRQDRVFAFVDATLQDHVLKSPVFKSANASLHKPPTGFELLRPSFKSRDAHANLQVTFMNHVETGGLAADIDIDQSSGVRHGFEVIENATFKKRTNPYLIREFLLHADPIQHTLDPGYEFMF